MNAVELNHVVKRYGRKKALDNLSFSIPEGSICALIGPNGAGKTTTMSLIAGLLSIDEGDVNLLGRGPFSIAEHGGAIGLMPQDSTPSLSAPLSALMVYYGQLQGLSASEAQSQSDEWLERVHLSDKKNARYGSLSHGMRRRFSIAQALLGRPSLVLLDEPTSGLDPELVVEVRNLITEQKGSCTIVVSSHILSELESMCDHAVILEQGSCVRQGPIAELTGKRTKLTYELSASPNVERIKTALPDALITEVKNELRITAQVGQAPEEVNALVIPELLAQKVGLRSIQLGGSLEEAYLERSSSKKASL